MVFLILKINMESIEHKRKLFSNIPIYNCFFFFVLVCFSSLFLHEYQPAEKRSLYRKKNKKVFLSFRFYEPCWGVGETMERKER